MAVQTATRQPELALRITLVLVGIIALATLATLVFGGPSIGPSFQVTIDPANGVWSW